MQFSDSTANFTVKVYFAQEFKEIRDLVFAEGEEAYVRSLSRCVPWAAHGGKSGSSFCKTKGTSQIQPGSALVSEAESQFFQNLERDLKKFLFFCKLPL